MIILKEIAYWDHTKNDSLSFNFHLTWLNVNTICPYTLPVALLELKQQMFCHPASHMIDFHSGEHILETS